VSILGFVGARRWLVELIAIAAVAALGWWFCHHLMDIGAERERAAWMQKAGEANLLAARAQGRADAAEAAGKREHDELKSYMASHPLHGSLASLCKPSRVPAATASVSGNVGAGTATDDVQPVSARDPVGDLDEPDQLGMLSLLAARADLLSGTLREWQARDASPRARP
jgi:hypothetical protein